jgi:TonB family protein
MSTGGFAVHFEVLRGDEVFLSKVLPPAVPLVIGPTSTTLPTDALAAPLPLLEPVTGGFGLHLAPPLSGQILVDDRRIGIVDGLLCDPRPEPLVLGDGSAGQLDLGKDNLTLRFFVQRTHRRFIPTPTIDVGLAIGLGLSTLLFGVVIAMVAPWEGERRRQTETRLVKQPGTITRLARLAPRPPLEPRNGTTTAKAERARRKHDVVRRRRRVARSPRRSPGAKRGVLGLLESSAPGLGRGTDTNRLIRNLDRTLASVSGSLDGFGRGVGGNGGGPDRLLGLLGSTSPAASEAPLPPVRLRLAPRRQPKLATAPLPSTKKTGPTREAIRKVVAHHGGEIRLCYERELLSSSTPLEGRLLLRWTIDGTGRVVDVEVVRDSVGSAPLRRCVLQRIRQWIFPPCESHCRITYPFDFYPKMS